MATTVNTAFNTFLNSEINLKKEQTSKARNSRDFLKEKSKTLTTSLPSIRVLKSIPFGPNNTYFLSALGSFFILKRFFDTFNLFFLVPAISISKVAIIAKVLLAVNTCWLRTRALFNAFTIFQ